MSALDSYRYATQRWRQANTEREQAAADRARALADMAAAGWDTERIARAVRLSPNRVDQLIAKARPQPLTGTGPGDPPNTAWRTARERLTRPEGDQP